MKKLFDLVVWETIWVISQTSDELIPVRSQLFYGNDGKVIGSYESFKTAIRICKEIRKNSMSDRPTPVDIGNRKSYTPKSYASVSSAEVSIGVVVNDREFIF